MRFFLAALVATLSTPLFAGDIVIEDAFARIARPGAPTGAAFMVIRNDTGQDDRLISVDGKIAKRVELHTHIEDDGVMKMREIEGGILIPAGGAHELLRGGDHVMLMGLTRKLENGETFDLILTFENAGDLPLTITVDNDRGQAGHKR